MGTLVLIPCVGVQGLRHFTSGGFTGSSYRTRVIIIVIPFIFCISEK